MSAFRALPLLKSEPEAWALMPAALARIALFCRKYDSDSSPDILCQSVIEHFVADEAKASVRVVVVVRDGEVVAHLLASLDWWCGKGYVTLVQYEADTAVPRALLQDGLDRVLWWAQGRGASTARVLARVDERSRARVRLFRSRYGFQARRIVMDRELSEGGR